MKVTNIDLYAYFGVTRPKGAKGYLHGIFFEEHLPEMNPKRLHPMILLVPGGSYRFVSYREGEPVALRFLTKGYNAFWLEYSHKDDGFYYPCEIIEGMMAITYLYKKAKNFASDPKDIALCGFSAGGHLTGLLGSLTQDEKALFPQYEKSGASIKGIVFSYPVVSPSINEPKRNYGANDSFVNLAGHNAYLIPHLGLEERIGRDFPPSYIWSTEADDCVSPDHARLLKRALDEKGVKNELRIFPRGGHGLAACDINCFSPKDLANAPVENAVWIDEAVRFLQSVGLSVKE